MTSKIKIRRGTKAQLPSLEMAEPGFTTDTKELYIGDGVSNVKIGVDDFDRQVIEVATFTATTTLTYVPLAGMILTTKDLGENSNVNIFFSTSVTHQSASEQIDFRLTADGSPVPVGAFSTTSASSDHLHSVSFTLQGTSIEAGTVFAVEWKQNKASGQNTATVGVRSLALDCIPISSIIS